MQSTGGFFVLFSSMLISRHNIEGFSCFLFVFNPYPSVPQEFCCCLVNFGVILHNSYRNYHFSLCWLPSTVPTLLDIYLGNPTTWCSFRVVELTALCLQVPSRRDRAWKHPDHWPGFATSSTPTLFSCITYFFHIWSPVMAFAVLSFLIMSIWVQEYLLLRSWSTSIH